MPTASTRAFRLGRVLRPGLSSVRRSDGLQSGLLLVLATLVVSGAGYLYNLICIRFLGPAEYGDVAALIALVTIVSLPISSIQYLLARDVAYLRERDVGQVRWLVRKSLVVSVPASAGVLFIGIVLAEPIAQAFKIGSPVTVVAGFSGIVVFVVATVFYGFLQGEQRFGALASSYAASGLARPVLVVPVLFAGLGAAGALGVNTVAGLAGLAIAAYALRHVLVGERHAAGGAFERREAAVLIAGSLAFVSLTNSDLLLASHFLSDKRAGVYAAAAFVGKFVLFLPSAVVTVLLPKASSRVAAGQTSARLFLASAAVTVALTLSAALLLAFTPESLLVRAFGPGFEESASLVGWFGLAMATAALASVVLNVYFAERDERFPMLLVLAALAQIVAAVAWHPNPRAFVVITFLCFSAVLLLNELFLPQALHRAWRRRDAPGAALTPSTADRGTLDAIAPSRPLLADQHGADGRQRE